MARHADRRRRGGPDRRRPGDGAPVAPRRRPQLGAPRLDELDRRRRVRGRRAAVSSPTSRAGPDLRPVRPEPRLARRDRRPALAAARGRRRSAARCSPLLAGLAVAGRAMRPISSLTAAAREIATTRDPSRRLPMPETEDEVAELAQTLDQMLRELDAARAETEQMIQAQREFVADASHELRTPLTSILANLELLEARLAERGRRRPDEARDRRRGARLVAADAPPGLRPAAARPRRRRARRAAAQLRPGRDRDRARSPRCARSPAGIELELDTPTGRSSVDGNPDDLHRLVLNLLENARPPHAAGHRRSTVIVASRTATRRCSRSATTARACRTTLGDQIFSRFVRGGGPADLAADSGHRPRPGDRQGGRGLARRRVEVGRSRRRRRAVHRPPAAAASRPATPERGSFSDRLQRPSIAYGRTRHRPPRPPRRHASTGVIGQSESEPIGPPALPSLRLGGPLLLDGDAASRRSAVARSRQLALRPSRPRSRAAWAPA